LNALIQNVTHTQLRKGNRLRVFEITGLRKVLGPKTGVLTGDKRKLGNEKLHDSYFS
jgi:hypothetical protein